MVLVQASDVLHDDFELKSLSFAFLDRLFFPSLNNVGMRVLTLLVLFSVFIHFGCNRAETVSLDDMYFFELVDTLRIDLMNDFGFVTNRAVDGYSLAYTYQEGVFHLINMSGEVEYSIDRRGEGPGEYSPNLSFATIFNGNFVFMDIRNLHFYGFNGDWIKSIPYQNSEVGVQAGIPGSDLYFFDSSRFVVPNQNIGYLGMSPVSLALLDTIPLWIEYNFSDATGQYEKSNLGLMDTTGILYSKLKYPNYQSMIWLQDGFLWQIPQISATLYQYRIGSSVYPLDKISLGIPNFKDPINLNIESPEIDNFKSFNKISAMNSSIGYVVPMDDGNFFAIYGTGVPEYEYDRLIEDGNLPEKESYGYYFDRTQSKGYSIPLPKNGDHSSFWNKVSYLGGDKFLFVFDNKIERDFYQGGVFILKER